MAEEVRTSPAELAGYAADARWELIPLHHYTKVEQVKGKPRNRGKSPMHSDWTKKPYASFDGRKHMEGGYNVGVRLKPDQLVVDVDPRGFPEGEDLTTDNPFRRLCEDVGLDVDQYPRVETGSGGLHLYMAKPADVPVRDSLNDQYPGVEFKSFGRQVVSAGSIHPDTFRTYEWDFLFPSLADGVRAAPAALVDLIARRLPDDYRETKAGKLTAEQLAEMLDALDPEDFRVQGEWLHLMMACHHATAGDGRQEFIDWSTQDPEYADHGTLIGLRWDSLHADGDGAKVTYRTLYRALRRRGHGEVIPEDYDDDLFDEPVDFPEPGDDDARDGGGRNRVLARLNAEYLTITKDGGYSVGRRQRNVETGHAEIKFFTEIAMRKEMDRRKIEVPDEKHGGLKRIGEGDFWLDHPRRRHYRHVTWNPDPSFKERETLNIFRGFGVQPDATMDWDALRVMIRDVICGGVEGHYDYVTRWVAAMVQRPHEPAGVVLNLQGPHNSGKGTLGRAITGLVAPHGVHILDGEQLTGKFNQHLAQCVALFVDEAFWSGDVKAQNKLKGLITEPTFMCEPKGVDAFPVGNRLHVVSATNNDWSAPTNSDDTRWAVFSPTKDARDRFKAEVGFGRILRGQGLLRQDVLSGWMAHLLTVDVDGWRADQGIPQTSALRAQFLHTARRDPLVKWWEGILQDGGPGSERISGWPDGDGEVGPAMKKDLEDHLEDAFRRMQHRPSPLSKAQIAKWLNDTFGYSVDGNVGSGRERRRGWRLPPLDKARSDFANMVGILPEEMTWQPFETQGEVLGFDED
ncbi:hypothetical protein roselon_00598 [Roseibacterium elongatum DSM 19469]|uniref:DNA primase/polymerase bifunctional N-terminal domain-containing protein n=1 Tax=Roseicyclus elongatus DSM 19469 TaxID=1294273 RepID=W8RPS9_9RHOB|nr:DUF5906 domain-containing protein [Roseibacterium elongatum]AHM03038.1 hypothetical protein roselon_00598 [Roseibacterium elongatum DSM 19469]